MFRAPVPQNTPRARAQTGRVVPIAIPARGLNARDTLALMGPENAIVLQNVLCESYGLRTRKGYREWATNIPPLGTTGDPVATMMSYYPAIASPTVTAENLFRPRSLMRRMLVSSVNPLIAPAGKLFAARTTSIYDVTAGGAGPWVPQAGVIGIGPYWSWLNFQNIAGSFLLACNHRGGYAIYDGATWSMPTMGPAAGQINNVDPAKLCFVIQHKKRLWFIESGTTRAWYLPVGQITGAANDFDFGEQFRAGGALYALVSWTVDGGIGVDDYLVAVSTQGDVVLYKGNDPDSATDWAIQGVWHVGPMPAGRRGVFNTGADVHLLSQFGVTPLSVLLRESEPGSVEQKRTTYLIGPLIARLMRDSSRLPGWQVRTLPKEEMIIITVPRQATENGGDIFALKYASNGWSLLKGLPYTSFVNIDDQIFAGTGDGRVVSAFDGPLDNVPLTAAAGAPINCIVTPAFQPLGDGGLQKRIQLVRPTFITTARPSLAVRILTDYQPPQSASMPTLPDVPESRFDESRWNEAYWSGLQTPIHEWLGCKGVGFVATTQLEYQCGGDTVLAAIDFWTEQGGAM